MMSRRIAGFLVTGAMLATPATAQRIGAPVDAGASYRTMTSAAVAAPQATPAPAPAPMPPAPMPGMPQGHGHPMPQIGQQMPHPGPRMNRWGGKTEGRWQGGYNAPGGWAAYRAPKRGWRMPGYWISPQFMIGNFGAYGLWQPPYGYRWSRYYDDAVLIDDRGRVVDWVGGVNWDVDDYGYDEGYAGYGYGYGYQGTGPGPALPPPTAYQSGPNSYTWTSQAGYAAGGYYYPPVTTTVVTVQSTPVVTTTTREYVIDRAVKTRRVYRKKVSHPRRHVARQCSCACGCK